MSPETDLLIIDDDENVVKLFTRLARQEKYSYVTAVNGYEAYERLDKSSIFVVVLDMHLPGATGFQILDHIRINYPEIEVVVITGEAKIEDAVKALKMGAFDYLSKPFPSMEVVISCLKQAYEKSHLKKKVKSLEEQNSRLEAYEGLVGKSKRMQETYRTIQDVSSFDSSILILGESGTGKELVAQAIHKTGKRARKPFVVINCSAIPETLMESELFGHVKGAFTGAIQDKQGLFEKADGGTVFLDEIGEIPLAIQVKLLRVLQEGEIQKVGGSQTRHVDVRVIAATHRDLKGLIEAGGFREDLYYRINVISLSLPPLRERGEDIPVLAHHFLRKIASRMGKQICEISIDALQRLQEYPWPGNVRELENIIERCLVLSTGPLIRAQDLPAKLLSQGPSFFPSQELSLNGSSYKEAKNKALALFHKAYLRHVLDQSEGNITLASAKAGLDRSNFKKIIRKYEGE